MAQSLANLLVHVQGPDAVKMRVLLTANTTETLWATRLGNDRYRIRSIPYQAANLHAEDVVYAPIKDGVPTLAAVVSRAGHRTVRLILEPGVQDEEFHRRWADFVEQGCRCEESRLRWYAIDIPPSADLELVRQLLDFGAADGVWCYEESSQRAGV